MDITQGEYQHIMETKVAPYLEERKKSGYLEHTPGERLYYEAYPADEPRGRVIVLHGYSEGIGKYREVTFRFLEAGYSVWLLQQREHGRSFRSTPDPSLIHVRDYRKMPEDAHLFLEQVVKREPAPRSLPCFLFGHSMGGGVAACCAQRYPEDFQKVILSSPMLEMTSSTPVWAAALYAGLMVRTGRGAAPLPGSEPFSGTPDFEHSCSNCLPRYLYWFEQVKREKQYQMHVATVSTALEFLKMTREAQNVKNCRRMKADVLLCQAGREDTVGLKGQETFIRRLGERGTLVRFDQAKHEIYMSTDDIQKEYWDTILTFLAREG